MNSKERLFKLLDFLQIGQAAFEKKVGISNGYTNNLKNSIGASVASKISIAFPDVNITWLLTGEGEMLKTTITPEAKAVKITEFVKIPFIQAHARAGYLTGYGDDEFIDELPTIPVIVDRNFKGKYRIFEIEGDSMDDGSRFSLYDGDKVLCREIRQDLWQYKLHIKDWYFVIVSKTEGIIVKQITDHNVETGYIICHPLNPYFDDITINLNDVVELYNVIKIVDRNTRI